MIKHEPKSHPQKLLIEHIDGILNNCSKVDLLKIAIAFHDVGKMNENFQKKINSEAFSGYSNHSYISCYYLINAFVNNKKEIISAYPFITEGNYNVVIIILANIIVGHHGYLRSINGLFNDEEWDKMVNYLKANSITDKVNLFFQQNKHLLSCEIAFVDDFNNEKFYKSYGIISQSDLPEWENDAINYYFDIISNYGELVYGDRKDASENELNYRETNNKKFAYALENNLEWIFNNFKSESELNKARNEIRNQALKSLLKNISESNRVFTLKAPTGSGKTLMMLQLASEIIKKFNYQHDVIYALPFLSIIDQTVEILNNNLKIQTLNFTSSSDVSDKLQTLMLESNCNSKEISEYAFSENCFDHPFVITTFNQIFETFFSNSTSKLMKLTNFKNRIFLIDEFQAVSPTMYAFFIQVLNNFCKKNNCYAIVSTATMPNINIDIDSVENYRYKKLLKENYLPIELLTDNIFNYKVFNRYVINFAGEVNSESLFSMINSSGSSTLLVLNTIATSKLMYCLFGQSNKTNFDKIYLINSQLSPFDRMNILSNIKKDLQTNTKVLVISTQVIEAGVDISFPVVYRDAAPAPSIIQANGRGNRNGEFGVINSFLFLYREGELPYDCDMVYQNMMSNSFKQDIINKISPMTEVEFHKKCEGYFWGLSKYVEQGKVNEEQNLIEDILRGNFQQIGRYQFIQSDPNSHTIYVGKNEDDWTEYEKLFRELKMAKDYKDRDEKLIKFKKIRSKILNNSISVRQKTFENIGVLDSGVFEIYKLKDNKTYSEKIGIYQ